MLDLKTLYDEDLVRDMIQAHFDRRGFQTVKESKDFYVQHSPFNGPIDLDCLRVPLQQRWIVEVKGENRDEANYVKDFQAVLTQLI